MITYRLNQGDDPSLICSSLTRVASASHRVQIRHAQTHDYLHLERRAAALDTLIEDHLPEAIIIQTQTSHAQQGWATWQLPKTNRQVHPSVRQDDSSSTEVAELATLGEPDCAMDQEQPLKLAQPVEAPSTHLSGKSMETLQEDLQGVKETISSPGQLTTDEFPPLVQQVIHRAPTRSKRLVNKTINPSFGGTYTYTWCVAGAILNTHPFKFLLSHVRQSFTPTTDHSGSTSNTSRITNPQP